MSSEMSKGDTVRPLSPRSTLTPNGTSTPVASRNNQQPHPPVPVPVAVPSTSRMRNPVPPSPLSRIQSPHHLEGSSNGTSVIPGSNNQNQSPESSPCFIHSHLDQHGSLQDWLKKGHQHPVHHSNGRAHPPAKTAAPFGLSPSHRHPIPKPSDNTSSRSTPTPSASASRLTSPTQKEPSVSGYESDRSSIYGNSGSAMLDGSYLEDDDEGGSLTKQLAETAQGVREMSKELGRNKVRSRIQHVLIVTKARDNRLIKLTRELALYLMQKKPVSSPDSAHPFRPGSSDRGMVVYVDAQLRTSKRFDAEGIQRDYPQLFQPVARRRSSSSTSINQISAFPSTVSMGDSMRRASKDEGQLRYWTSEMCSNSPHLFDFVITLGGDGTVLFTSWLFQRIVPPVLPFALGSLGFLTNFDFAGYKETMDRVIDDGIRVNLRMRFTCTVYRAIAPEEAARAAGAKGGKKRKAIKRPGGEILMSQVENGGWEALEGTGSKAWDGCNTDGKDKEIMCFTTRPVEQFEVLNDLVVDRGPSPFVSLLELFGDEHHLTTVQADGLTVSTPTGSTAYSLSAGGSLVHPQIPALLITPICPHTLSFRPMLLPDSMELRICVPYNSRSTAWASFDGRGRVELKQGDHIKVTASKYPFPTVCRDKASPDWFSSISRTLRWNEREKQKSFVVVEEDTEPMAKPRNGKVQSGHHRDTLEETKKHAAENMKLGQSPEEKDEDEGGKELENGDIDDEEEDDDEEEEEDFDIDDKSDAEGTNGTNPSSPQFETTDPPIPNRLHSLAEKHKDGVDTPDRFAVPYAGGPPPISQRHLVEALHKAEIMEKKAEMKEKKAEMKEKKAEIMEKANEQGQWDDIHADGSAFRVDLGSGSQGHLIPPGRSTLTSPLEDQKTPKAAPRTVRSRQSTLDQDGRSGDRKEKKKGKCKAFAFFGHDESDVSDCSDC
ncbi:hypothetical protein BCR39DRAFT_519922 [Naematelia encephala]|uniref:ATP-NAD kinase-like domain-containing protein n=1 Tax=Naematelia encephala TaxID=71784 RepID=A0A1Y2BFD5_9TREE|nr:hypothetical protein BCR39DRAFT_519922 [Naematelia encephala]